MYRAKKNGFEVIKYINTFDPEKKRFKKLADIDLKEWKGRVIGGGSAHFGNIVECENALVVVQSDGNTFTIPEPVTRWRVYPRSLNYENHLHVILDDRLEIYSFHHDYFSNQMEKNIGIEFQPKEYKTRIPVSYLDESDNDEGNDDFDKKDEGHNIDIIEFDIDDFDADDLPF
jgi:hypothetical protein